MVRAASRIVRAISFGVFLALSPFNQANHVVKEAFTRIGRYSDYKAV